jgi:phage-related protein
MITFKTKIKSMSTVIEPVPNYIVGVVFTVTGTIDSIISSVDSFVNFDIDPTQTNIAPYSELTEEQVLSWIDSSLIGSMQSCVQGQIDAILNPPIVPEETPLPWATK